MSDTGMERTILFLPLHTSLPAASPEELEGVGGEASGLPECPDSVWCQGREVPYTEGVLTGPRRGLFADWNSFTETHRSAAPRQRVCFGLFGSRQGERPATTSTVIEVVLTSSATRGLGVSQVVGKFYTLLLPFRFLAWLNKIHVALESCLALGGNHPLERHILPSSRDVTRPRLLTGAWTWEEHTNFTRERRVGRESNPGLVVDAGPRASPRLLLPVNAAGGATRVIARLSPARHRADVQRLKESWTHLG
ncbi:unnamed protein product [Lampetra planeri]